MRRLRSALAELSSKMVCLPEADLDRGRNTGGICISVKLVVMRDRMPWLGGLPSLALLGQGRRHNKRHSASRCQTKTLGHRHNRSSSFPYRQAQLHLYSWNTIVTLSPIAKSYQNPVMLPQVPGRPQGCWPKSLPPILIFYLLALAELGLCGEMPIDC
jgi:hypothetical protein